MHRGWNGLIPVVAVSRMRWVEGLALVGGLLAAAWLIGWSGGVNELNPTIVLLPALLAAWRFGLVGGVLGGMGAGWLVGPWMPASPDAAQPWMDWWPRFLMYTLIGCVAGGMMELVRRQLSEVREERDRFATLRSLDLTILNSRRESSLYEGLSDCLAHAEGVRGLALYTVEEGPASEEEEEEGQVRLELQATRSMEALFERQARSGRVLALATEALKAGDEAGVERRVGGRMLTALPLAGRDATLGVVVLAMEPGRAEARFIEAITGQLAIALTAWVDRQRAERVSREALFQMAALTEARDGYGESHVLRVEAYSHEIAFALGVGEAESREIARASLVHDVGKIRVPESILNKPAKLTEEEFAQVKRHAMWGGQILERLGLGRARIVARHHHERWDGRGYPDGLAGEKIPIPARIVAVADVFDALISKRCYKAGWPVEAAVETIRQDRGSHFAPDVADAFLALHDAGRIERIMQKFSG